MPRRPPHPAQDIHRPRLRSPIDRDADKARRRALKLRRGTGEGDTLRDPLRELREQRKKAKWKDWHEVEA